MSEPEAAAAQEAAAAWEAAAQTAREQYLKEQARAVKFAWACATSSELSEQSQEAPSIISLRSVGEPPWLDVSVVPVTPLALAPLGFSVSISKAAHVKELREALCDWFRVDSIKMQFVYEGSHLDDDLTLIENNVDVPGVAARRRGECLKIGMMLEASLDNYKAVECRRCKETFLTLVEFDDVIKCRYCNETWNRAEDAGDDAATRRLLDIVTRACPRCGQRIAHYHGHDCHTISPSGGCTNCGQNFCYLCLRQHGEPGQYGGPDRPHPPVCNSKKCPVFCNNAEITRFLVLEPYPYDSRCGCALCPDCRLGKPCWLCRGQCVVCQGLVAPVGVAVAEESATA